MRTDRVALNYQREDNVLLRFDRLSREPLGLTFIDYSKLKKLHSVPFENFSGLPEGVEQTIRDILLSDPVCRFIETNTDTSGYFTVINPSMENVIAA